MNNKDIARAFRVLGELMILHGENEFRTRTYSNAYLSLRKIERPFAEMDASEIGAIRGVGKSIATKVQELLESGTLEALEGYYSITPIGVRELLNIKGLGPKKVKQIWEEMEIETPGELLYACYENRLVEYKGFGLKTQQALAEKIEYYLESQGKSTFAGIENDASELLILLKTLPEVDQAVFVGELARLCPVIETAEILIDNYLDATQMSILGHIKIISIDDSMAEINFKEKSNYLIHFTDPESFVVDAFIRTGSEEFSEAWENSFEIPEDVASEDDIFESAGIAFIPPEAREDSNVIETFKEGQEPLLIELEDLKGILHNHSTYSDGLHSLMDMSKYVKESGYAYFSICDHSKSAGYAGGLKVEEVLKQWDEIDEINKELAPFKVFKGIESDILVDGSLDYDEEILKGFDMIVASIHSVLNMDEKKATNRLIKAIENPYTTILGHPTGRLLLAREGYPIDHEKVIEACAANNVSIELNANPLRLDMDWTWIEYAMDKGVLISINPDAHSKEAIHLVKYGIMAARKGLLTADMCLNAKSLSDFENYLKNRFVV